MITRGTRWLAALISALVLGGCASEPPCTCGWPTETNTSPVVIPEVLPVAEPSTPHAVRIFDTTSNLAAIENDPNGGGLEITANPMRGGGAQLGPGAYGSFHVGTAGPTPGLCMIGWDSLDGINATVRVSLYQNEAILVPGGALICDDFTNYGVEVNHVDSSAIAGAPWAYR